MPKWKKKKKCIFYYTRRSAECLYTIMTNYGLLYRLRGSYTVILVYTHTHLYVLKVSQTRNIIIYYTKVHSSADDVTSIDIIIIFRPLPARIRIRESLFANTFLVKKYLKSTNMIRLSVRSISRSHFFRTGTS